MMGLNCMYIHQNIKKDFQVSCAYKEYHKVLKMDIKEIQIQNLLPFS